MVLSRRCGRAGPIGDRSPSGRGDLNSTRARPGPDRVRRAGRWGWRGCSVGLSPRRCSPRRGSPAAGRASASIRPSACSTTRPGPVPIPGRPRPGRSSRPARSRSRPCRRRATRPPPRPSRRWSGRVRAVPVRGLDGRRVEPDRGALEPAHIDHRPEARDRADQGRVERGRPALKQAADDRRDRLDLAGAVRIDAGQRHDEADHGADQAERHEHRRRVPQRCDPAARLEPERAARGGARFGVRGTGEGGEEAAGAAARPAGGEPVELARDRPELGGRNDPADRGQRRDRRGDPGSGRRSRAARPGRPA